MLAKSTTTDVERDAVLWKEMKEGNEFAFREIFDSYSDLLFQYGITISKDRELVKDCIQELFIVVWTNRFSIGIARSIKYYLFFSLRRLLLKKLRRSRNLFSLSSFNSMNLTIESPYESIARREMHVHSQLLISDALDSLPPRQKEIIFLKFYQELKYDEIEKIMNLNNQVVRNTLYKALSALRRQLEKNQMTRQILFILMTFLYYAISI